MTYLYLDIETIPAQTQEKKDRIAASVKAPGTITKAESLEAWEKDKKPQAVLDAIDKTSFNGAYGHICCIGWAIGDEEIESESIWTIGKEKEVLERFFRYVSDEIDDFHGVTIVGHYVAGFDLRFLLQRAMVLGVRVPIWWPKDPKPWGNEVFDTMTAWAGAKDTISLDNLCFALGIEGKGDIDGSMISQLWNEGRHEEIALYCRQDVGRVRKVHQKMLVALGE